MYIQQNSHMCRIDIVQFFDEENVDDFGAKLAICHNFPFQ